MAPRRPLAVTNLVCDLDGVVYLGDTGIPGAGDTLRDLDERGIHVVFATNNATLQPEDVAAKIARTTGYAPPIPSIVTSAMATAEAIAGDVERALVLGERGIDAALQAVGVDVTDDPGVADAVVIGLDRSVTYDRIAAAASAARMGARIVATNADATYPTERGLLPGAGTLVAAVERASGRTAEVIGKPHAPMRRSVARRLVPGPTAVVGDRPETDLELAGDAGWARILVLTGVTATPEGVVPAPDLVVESLADLPGALA